jgi:hypothetical protein
MPGSAAEAEDATDGDRITAIHVIRNPDKLAWLRDHQRPIGSVKEPAVDEDAPDKPGGRQQ